MPITALPLQDKISQSSTSERQYPVIKAKYGNGYSERARDGLTPIMDTHTINYENLSASEYTSALAAFDASFGVSPFSWQAYGDSTTKHWIVMKISRSVQSGSVYSISVSIEQDNNLVS